MEPEVQILITLGALLLLGLVTDLLGRRTPLPRVTLLLTFGFVIGPTVLNILPDLGETWFQTVVDITLVMVGFLLGGTLTKASIGQHGRLVLWISIGVVLITAAVMVSGLILIGVRADLALLLAGIAPSTAPAATIDVVRESRAKGPFTRTLLGIVAVDDAWGIILFSIVLTVCLALHKHGQGGIAETLLFGAWELGAALLLGIVLGVPMAYLTGRIRPGEPTLVEALGLVLLCGGIARWIGASFLLASIVMGMIVSNLARHHRRPFHAIEGIEWPFMILFFVLAGASFQIGSIHEVGILGLGYVALRVIGRVLGTWVGGSIGGADPPLRRWMGMALMPQAGVALGLTLVATQRFPELADVLLPVVIGASILFEVFGPILTRRALIRMGEIDTDAFS